MCTNTIPPCHPEPVEGSYTSKSDREETLQTMVRQAHHDKLKVKKSYCHPELVEGSYTSKSNRAETLQTVVRQAHHDKLKEKKPYCHPEPVEGSYVSKSDQAETLQTVVRQAHHDKFLVFVLLLILTVASCMNSDQDTANKTVFNLNMDEGLTSLDPAFSRNQNAMWAVNQVYNGLVQIDDSLNIRPCIAKSWEADASGTQYTFHLRKDVHFHDDPLFAGRKGRKVVAADVAYSFWRLIDPKVASSGSWIFSDKVTGKDGFVAVNDSTFRLKLKQPFPPLLTLLTAQYCSIVPKEVAGHYGKDFRSHPIGTGPFQFKYWKEREVLVLVKNPHYWEKDSAGKQLPYLDAVRVSFIADKQTGFMEFISGKLDFYNDVDGSYRDDVLSKAGHVTSKYQGKFILNSRPFLNTLYMGMLVDTNLAIVKNSPLKIKKVRQAINYAINKQKMVKYLRNSLGTPGTSGFIPMGMPGFDAQKVKGYSYDPIKARQLLAEAGFPEGRGMPEIVLHTTVGYRSLIEFVQGELTRIGINTRVEVIQGGSLRELVSKNGVNFFYATWIADYADGENYLSLFYSKNKIPYGPNYTGFNNKKYDELFERAYHVKDNAERYKLYQQMDQLIMDESPVVVLYYDKLVNMYQNNISGYSNNAQNLLILKNVIKHN